MKTKKILAGMISFLMMVSSFSMHNIGLSVCCSAITANAETEDSSENSDDVIMLHTESEAIDYVYRNMINRRSNITFSYASEENLDFDFVNEILNKVFEHNSSPSGGDYLRWQAKNITSELYIEEIENTKKYTISYYIKYLTTYEQEEYVDQRTDEIINQLDLEDKNDYEKVDAIYKYICNNISYDYENLSDSSYTKKYTAYAALADGTCVCEGYALLLYNMLLKAGIDCRIIVGNAGCFMEGFEDYEYHAWNIVGLDGKYYNVDSTWDSGLDNYEWFLLSDETFNELEAKGHKPDEEYITESFQNKYPMSDVDNPYEEELSGLHNEIEWKLYKGRLELSGYGEINGNLLDYPWSNYISKVKEIVVNEGITSIGNYAFYDATYLKSVTLPNSLKHIGINSFSNCMSLEEVIIPDSVEQIDSYAFNCCYNLKTAILSKNIAVLSEGVFSGCENLNEIDIPNSVTRIEKNSLSAQGLTRIEIPSSVKYIGSLAFEGSNINEIYIPDSVEVIDGGAFSSCSINKINVSENNSAFCTKDNVLYNKEMKKLISYPAGLESDTFSVPIGVEEIADYAFEHSWNIKNIYFPDTLKVIGSNSFENCRINSCDFPEALKSIGNEAFRNCKLVKIEIPTSLDYLGVAAFSGNTDLEKVVIHNGITIIPERVFEGTGLKSIELPDSIEQIEMGAFSFCKALTSLDTNHVKDIGEIAFWCCDSLENIRFDSDLRSIGNQSFEGCTNLKILYVDSEKLTIGSATFNNCNNLQKIYYIGDIESWNNNVKISDENNECIFNTEIDCYKETSSTTTTSTTTTTQPVTTTTSTTTSTTTTTTTTSTTTTSTTTSTTTTSTTTSTTTTSTTTSTTSTTTSTTTSSTTTSTTTTTTTTSTTTTSTTTSTTTTSTTTSTTTTSTTTSTTITTTTTSTTTTSTTTSTTTTSTTTSTTSTTTSTTTQPITTIVTTTLPSTTTVITTTIPESGEGIIDNDKLQNPEEGDNLPVEAGPIQAVFDYNAMIEIEHRHGNKDIKFSYKVVEKEKLEENEAIKEALKDSDQLFEFDLSDSNGKKVEFSSDSNKGVVTITIPYNKPVSANEVKVFYISPTGEKIDMNGKYDPSTKTITFDTTHFSYYSIVAVYEESITTTTTTPVTTITTTSTTTATTAIITTTTTTAITTLPQTGYSDIYSIIIYGAGILTLLGVATIVLSKRKEI